MGNFSDVVLVLDKIGYSRLQEAMNEATEDVRKLFQLNREFAVEPGTGMAIFYWQGIKWYWSEPELKFVEAFLEDLEDEQYLFIRLGEDGSLDTRGGLYDNPFQPKVVSKIQFNRIGKVPGTGS